MKGKVRLGFVVILIALAMAQIVAWDVFAETTIISGNVRGSIQITAPSGISSWELDSLAAQPNTQTGTLNVKANQNWQVKVKDADATNTNGLMAEWDGAAYVSSGNKLLNAMKVAAASEITLPTEGNIQTGTKTTASGQDVTVTFKQTVSWDDQILTGGHTYRIVVTFTGSLVP